MIEQASEPATPPNATDALQLEHVSRNPSDQKAYKQFSAANANGRQAGELALAAALRAIALEPKAPEAYLQAAAVYDHWNRPEPSKEILLRCIEHCPKSHDAHLMLAKTYRQLHELDHFNATIERCLELQPGSPAALNERATLVSNQNNRSINICFYGLNRSLSRTINSINKHLFEALKSNNVQYTIFGAFANIDNFSNTRSNEFNANAESNAELLIDFESCTYIDQETTDRRIPWERVFQFGDLYNEINSDADFHLKNSTTKNIFRSLFLLKSSYALVPSKLSHRPTIFLRPDLEILNKLDIPLYLSLLQKKPLDRSFGNTDGVALFPSWHSWDGLNDRFAICTSGNASYTYANRFDFLLPYIEFSRHPIHPETFLFHVMRVSHVESLPVINTLMSRVRANKSPKQENFEAGSRSYNMQSETINELQSMLSRKVHELEDIRKFIPNHDTLFNKEIMQT